MSRLLGVGVQTRLLKFGSNANDPETVPAKLPVPPLGFVWLMVSVNVTPAGKLVIGQEATVHVALNDPKSTSEPDRNVPEPTGVNDRVKSPNVQTVVVHAAFPLNAPVVENVTVCAPAGSEPSARAAAPTTAALVIPRIPMIPPATCRCEALASTSSSSP